MKYLKIILEFSADNSEDAEELVCEILFSLNVKGVICDGTLPPPDDGFNRDPDPFPPVKSVTGFLPLTDQSDSLMTAIGQKAQRLKPMDIDVTIKTDVVDEEMWSESWKDHFDVIRISDRIVIKPDWKEYSARENDIVIHLDPGMAFGTGTHPTTFMCLKIIEHYLVPGAKFLDVGTGSGILMIAAAKLGAGKIIGIDYDEIAVKIARQNLEKNQIDPSMVTLACSTMNPADPIHVGGYNLIAANILAQVIVDIMPELSDALASDGIAILSGIVTQHRKAVLKALEAHNFKILHEKNVDEWVTLAVGKRL